MKSLTLVSMFLMAASLSGCDSAPDLHPKLIDHARNRFHTYELTDRENFEFSKRGWTTGLEKLDGHYCFSAKEIANYNSWARRQADRLKQCEAAR
ncbi:MAG: hypothetical protein KF767_08840 [Bdellovibrionaceae bacterium]|nr:hypothetical protein [Pseudobdellovibrionaceae bacterium]